MLNMLGPLFGCLGLLVGDVQLFSNELLKTLHYPAEDKSSRVIPHHWHCVMYPNCSLLTLVIMALFACASSRTPFIS
jgi:hypothetical protein